MYRTEQIDLYFGDESGFSMNPCIPYGWQAKGEQVSIFPRTGKKINVFGLFRPDNHSVSYATQDTINSAFLIQALNRFCQFLTKPTLVVLDNAPTHRSKLFQQPLPQWQEKDLFIFLLPKYSPHLNLAETFWPKAKYEWLKPQDYHSFTAFKEKINHIFNKIGQKYRIHFNKQAVINNSV